MTYTYKIRFGGLLRCCTQSLDNQIAAAEVEPPAGTVLTCEYCKQPNLIRAADGT